MRFLLVGLFLTISVGSSVCAQDRLPPGVRGGDSAMATRSVNKYLQLERSLQTAIQDKDATAIKPLLTEDFEFRSANKPDADDMETWMKSVMAGTAVKNRVRDLNVREFENTAIVSFYLDRDAASRVRETKTTSFVVDVWRQPANQLVARYISAPGKPAPRPTRPSGRE